MIASMAVLAASLLAQEPVRIGSKAFTESVILGEIGRKLLDHEGVPAIHRRELGGSPVLFQALEADELDLYPEYTGTITGEILSARKIRDEKALRAALAERGIGMSRPMGFNNTYAIGMQERVAERLGIRKLSDLRDHPGLKLGFSNEFMERADGWPGLRDRYGLPQRDVRGLEHVLAYRAIEAGEIQATDLYSTDAEIRAYELRVLEDDRRFFPSYECVWLYRADLPQRSPSAMQALSRLEGRIAAGEMAGMNARAKIDRWSEDLVASEFLKKTFGIAPVVVEDSLEARLVRRLVELVRRLRVEESLARRLVRRLVELVRRLGEHLTLVGISLGTAILVAIPLGVIAAHWPRLGSGILAVTGIIQTIPSLALLMFMLPLLGIGAKPTIVALFLYSLLPIIRNTATGLRDIPPSLRESAEAMGLPPRTRLSRIELPLASRAILAGIKTAAVINVGTATIGALIGAGGFGQPIVAGLRRLDIPMILFEGAIPAAVLALAVQGLFDLAERFLVPRGLRA